jgi:transcriptional regulator with XRE-family HTH domain
MRRKPGPKGPQGASPKEPKMVTKSPNPVDRHVGSRVRMRRMLVGMSQEKLGEALGITFQQIQKYEKGTNRIGASRLHQIARVLSVPVEFFYEGAPQVESPGGGGGFAEAPPSGYVSDFLTTSEGLELIKAFIEIKDPKIRRKLVDLAKALGQAG